MEFVQNISFVMVYLNSGKVVIGKAYMGRTFDTVKNTVKKFSYNLFI
jgi:hypothetical protein